MWTCGAPALFPGLQVRGRSTAAGRLANKAVEHQDGAGPTTSMYRHVASGRSAVSNGWVVQQRWSCACVSRAGSVPAPCWRRAMMPVADYGVRSLCRVRLLIFQPSDVFTKTSS